MADLIDRAALLAAFEAAEEDDIELYGVHISDCFPSERAAEIANNLPAVDAVEVVRCKDCDMCTVRRKKNGVPYFYKCDFNDIKIEPDDFCSHGERRADDAFG